MTASPVLLVAQAHPGLGEAFQEKLAMSLSSVAQAYGTDVGTLVAETVRAENSSAAGNDLTT